MEIWSIFLHTRYALIPNFGGIFGTKYLTVSPLEGQSVTLSLSLEKVNVTYLSDQEDYTCSETATDYNIELCLEKTLMRQGGCRYTNSIHSGNSIHIFVASFDPKLVQSFGPSVKLNRSYLSYAEVAQRASYAVGSK